MPPLPPGYEEMAGKLASLGNLDLTLGIGVQGGGILQVVVVTGQAELSTESGIRLSAEAAVKADNDVTLEEASDRAKLKAMRDLWAMAQPQVERANAVGLSALLGNATATNLPPKPLRFDPAARPLRFTPTPTGSTGDNQVVPRPEPQTQERPSPKQLRAIYVAARNHPQWTAEQTDYEVELAYGYHPRNLPRRFASALIDRLNEMQPGDQLKPQEE